MNPRRQILYGMLLGFFTAFIISLVIFLGTNPGMTYRDYFYVFTEGKILAPILSISLLGNFGLFFLFIRLNKDHISRGLLVSTMITGIIILAMKFL